MNPNKKLLLAAIVLAIGVGLSWPFRIRSDHALSNSTIDLPTNETGLSHTDSSQHLPPIVHATRPAAEHDLATTSSTRLAVTELPPLPVRQVAKPIVQQQSPPELAAQYDPDLDLEETVAKRPAYSTADASSFYPSHSSTQQPVETIHEVENSDTLAKLAKRYLGDPARALEIFDLNRDKLRNPHLLPIGAELRIPVEGQRTID